MRCRSIKIRKDKRFKNAGNEIVIKSRLKSVLSEEREEEDGNISREEIVLKFNAENLFEFQSSDAVNVSLRARQST